MDSPLLIIRIESVFPPNLEGFFIAEMADKMDLTRITQPTDKDWARLRKYETILPGLQQRLQEISSAED